MGFIGDEIFDVNQHFSTTDEGEYIELSGSIYALTDEGEESEIFFLNPVYETSTGEIYVTTGNGISGHAGEVPAEMKAAEGVDCLIVETQWEDGEVTRELYEPEKEESSFVESFYKASGR